MSIKETKYRLPEELLANFYSIYSPGVVDGVLRAMEAKRKTTLRINTIKASEKDILQELTENRIKFAKCNWYNEGIIVKEGNERQLSDLNCYSEGKIYLQSLSSMLPALFLELKKGMKVLDMAAAPGSKTTQIAAILNNEGYILANEVNSIRAERLKYNLSKMGASCAEVRIGDGKRLGNLYPEKFDRVMLDAPCGGEGIINMKDCNTYKNWRPNTLSKNSKLQKGLLDSGRKALKKGGILVYSTCTISAEENEEVIHWFVNTYSDMKIKGIYANLKNCCKGLNSYKGKEFHKDLEKTLRVVPSEDMEGFFICKMVKV